MRHIKHISLYSESISGGINSDLAVYALRKFIGRINSKRDCYVSNGKEEIMFSSIFDAIDYILDGVRSNGYKENSKANLNNYILVEYSSVGLDYGYKSVQVGYNRKDLKEADQMITLDVMVQDKRYVSKLNRMFSNTTFIAGKIKFYGNK